MEKSITQNYWVEPYSNLLVKTLSIFKQLHQFGKQNLSNIIKEEDPFSTLSYVSQCTSSVDIEKLATQVPGVCSVSVDDSLSFTIIQKKKGYVIPIEVIVICSLFEKSKNRDDFIAHIKEFQNNPYDNKEAYFIESSLIAGKGLQLRSLQQKANKKYPKPEELKTLNSKTATAVANHLCIRYDNYKMNLSLTDFAQLAEKMKKDDYPLFKKHPTAKLIMGSQAIQDISLYTQFKNSISYLSYYQGEPDADFEKEVQPENNLILMNEEFGETQHRSNLTFFGFANQQFFERKILNSRFCLIGHKLKGNLEVLQKKYSSLLSVGDDKDFVYEQLIMLLESNDSLRFDLKKIAHLPKRNELTRNPLILWGDTNRTQENEDYYNDLRKEFAKETIIQIFSSQEMRRIPIDNPNQLHLVIMCGSFATDVKNNISNLNWCQQSILEYDLNCTHVILFTSDHTVKANKWDNSFRKQHPNLLITTNFNELILLIKKENFLNVS